MNVGDLIYKKRKELGFTLEDVGKSVGVSKSTVRKWETGYISNMKRDKIALLAKKLQINPTVLIAEMDEDITPLPSNSFPYTPPRHYAPVLGSVRAGTGGLAVQEVIGEEPIDDRYAMDNEDYFWLRVTGDSMAPHILEGDLVLIRATRSVDSGSLAVVTVDDKEGVLKEVRYGPDWIELHSYNPYYPVRRFDGENVLQICVMGKAMEIRRKV